MQTISIHFTHDCTFLMYTQLVENGSGLMLLPFSTLLGIPLFWDTGQGRAATHQLYSSAIQVWYAPLEEGNNWARSFLIGYLWALNSILSSPPCFPAPCKPVGTASRSFAWGFNQLVKKGIKEFTNMQALLKSRFLKRDAGNAILNT